MFCFQTEIASVTSVLVLPKTCKQLLMCKIVDTLIFKLTCCLSDCVNITWLGREGKPYKQRSLQHMARQRNQVFDVTN